MFRDAPLVVWGAIILHVVVAILLLADPAAGRSTGPAEVVQVLGRTGGIIGMLACSALALGAILFKAAPDLARTFALIPQQLLLYLAAWGGLQAVIAGHYADGVTRPHEFILSDQLPVMLLAVIHTLSIIEFPWDAN
jgi:hypothetical protein